MKFSHAYTYKMYTPIYIERKCWIPVNRLKVMPRFMFKYLPAKLIRYLNVHVVHSISEKS